MISIGRIWLIVGIMIAIFGLWLIFGSSDADAPEQEALGDRASTTEPTTPPDTDVRSPATSPTPTEGSSIGPEGEELAGLTLQTLPSDTSNVTRGDQCDETYAGLGVEMQSWGDVLLPYTPGYPTSSPGDLWDCTPKTVFGAAIAMAHAAYLDALRPELIQNIALPTDGRSTRRREHPGGNASASLGYGCSPVGWNWDGATTWSLLHACGEREPKVTYFEMRWEDGRWWMIYPDDGEIASVEPPPGYQYYPYLGGD